MRLFAAIWPPEDVLDHLDLALASVRGAPSGLSSAVRWSARETWHLTAAFYGDVPDGAVPGLTADLAARAVQVWTALFGLVSFELFGQTHNVVERHEEFFHGAVERLGDLLGLPPG